MNKKKGDIKELKENFSEISRICKTKKTQLTLIIPGYEMLFSDQGGIFIYREGEDKPIMVLHPEEWLENYKKEEIKLLKRLLGEGIREEKGRLAKTSPSLL